MPESSDPVGLFGKFNASFLMAITPEYRSDRFAAGVVLQGSTDFFLQDNNDLKQEAYNLVNLFANWNVNDSLLVYLNVNNHYEGCAPATIDRIASIFER